MNKTIFKRLGWLAMLTGIGACGLEEIDPDKTVHRLEFSPAINIGTDTVNVIDLLEDLSEGEEDNVEYTAEEGEPVTMIFRDRIEFSKNDDIVDLPTQTFNHSFPTIAGSNVYTIPFTFTSVIGASRLDSLYYSGGMLNYSLAYPNGLNDYQWGIRNTFYTTTGLEFNSGAKVSLAGPVNEVIQEDLSNFKTYFETGNQINLFLDGEFVGAGPNATLNLSFENPSIKLLYALFDKKQLNMDPVSFDMSGIEELRSIGVKFTDPKLILECNNDYGADVLLGFDNVTGVLEDGSSIELENTIAEKDRLILAATNANTPTKSAIEINKDNSNIDDLISAQPDRIEMPLLVEINPDISSATQNFMADTSEIVVDAIMEIPMTVQLKDYSYDFEYDLGDISDLEDAQQLAIQIAVDNEMPIFGLIELYILDERGNVISSLVDSQEASNLAFDSPTVGDDGSIAESKVTVTRISLVKEDIDKTLTAATLKVVLKLESFDVDNLKDVSFFSDAKIAVTVGALVDFDLEL
ncbi:hypothetical protein [Reichenbachiella versicolor]|uniref:hypothetical protein n=1 Tax=Reichenbachiella versicolor TaxID=1821036 RepID=UPI000D6E2979|nr:hypothetical protein [Reichenbachiella versicolor]